MDFHMLQLAVQIIFALRQPRHIGEQVGRPVGPISRVTLPETLGSVRCADGQQLCPRVSASAHKN